MLAGFFLGLCPSATATAPARARAAPTMALAKPSNALPFLTAPKCQTSNLPGAEAGFDPLYLSDYLDLKWMREAELKHGRVCMLAATGVLAQELFQLPNYPGYTPNAVDAFNSVPSGGLLQVTFHTNTSEAT